MIGLHKSNLPPPHRVHSTPLTLSRLPRPQATRLVHGVTGGKPLPAEVLAQAELHRLQGELLLMQAIPDEQQAAACFRQAIDIARHQQAKSLELRAAMSLGRMWQRQGETEPALQLLAEVYAWFTEGFDTADLQEAKAWLEQWV
jgi:tetratricopeptide (TPR) repeat protein